MQKSGAPKSLRGVLIIYTPVASLGIPHNINELLSLQNTFFTKSQWKNRPRRHRRCTLTADTIRFSLAIDNKLLWILGGLWKSLGISKDKSLGSY